jgi:hypothetical protein
VKKLRIDYAARRTSPWVGRVLLALAATFWGHMALSYMDVRSALQANEARLAQSQARPAPLKAVPPEELAEVRATVERLGMPWGTLFGALETAATDQVALLGIEPDPKAGTVLISGDSKNYLAALTYVLNLSRADALTQVQLVRHEAKAGEPDGPVSFTVSAAWGRGR